MLVTEKRITNDQTHPGTNIQWNPSFFIVGCPRSGLSLLGRLLDGHPLLAVAPNVYWISEHFETRLGLNLEARLASEPVVKWLEQKRFDAFALPREQIRRLIAPGQLLPHGTFLSRLLDLYGAARKKPLVGSITPQFARLMPSVHAQWPGSKFIHLIRDGRDVALSVLDRETAALHVSRHGTWADDPVSTIALWWRDHVHQARGAGRTFHPDLYYEVSYESILADLAGECRNLCAFLEVPFDDAMLHDQEDWRGRDSAVVRPITVGFRNWSTQMTPEAVERFEAGAGTLLEEFGYPRATPPPKAETLQWVAQIEERFVQEARRPWLAQPALAKHRKEIGAANPFVFIIGCPRSGTTLLQRLMNAHPDLAITDETFWIPFFFKKRIGLTPEAIVTPELIDRLFSYYKFYRMKIAAEELWKLYDGEKELPYAHLVSLIFDRYGEFWGKPLVGDKTPDYVRDIPTLHQLWPEAKFVHLIRDGRDVCLSALQWSRKAARFESLFSTWAKEPIATAAAWWQWHVRRGREDGGNLGPCRYYEMRYESLVNQPAEECSRLCDFLGLPYAASMLRFHEGRAGAEGSQDAKTAWLPITPGLRDWRTQMPAKHIECFEAVAGPLLGELGYSRAVANPCQEMLANASFIVDRFGANVDVLGDWLP
ncbi:MAG TPA: sulfotransferase [Gemmataceae bacterium]|nr:sulfotransferase [Gemmataceae bacterium]